jgi:hypothetical protein
MLAVKLHRVRRLAHFKSMHWQEGGSNWGGTVRNSRHCGRQPQLATRHSGGHQEVPPESSENRTSGAKALIAVAFYGTAKAVP